MNLALARSLDLKGAGARWALLDLPERHLERSRSVIQGEQGLAPAAELVASTAPHPPQDGIPALVRAIEATLPLRPHVLLINLSFNDRYPVMQAGPVRAALSAAWAAGCLPVLPAGNAQHDLDGARDLLTQRPLRECPEVGDPPWLLVGALHPETGAPMGTQGSGVACRHWGHNVRIPGIHRFSGSSAAAALVAGIALLCVGGMLDQERPFTPRALRELLSDPAHQDPAGMPILQRVLGACGLHPAA